MSVSRDGFLAAMRQVAATVTVVTTDGPAGRMGATVSAFTSLSADPPSVLVCLKTDSRIARAVAGNGCFCVNILPEDGDLLARRFAGDFDVETEDRFADVPVCPMPHGPALPRATTLACVLDRTLTHATHAICIGRVMDIHDAGEAPLTYMQGGFHIVRPKPV